jgi:hypothetical protein
MVSGLKLTSKLVVVKEGSEGKEGSEERKEVKEGSEVK